MVPRGAVPRAALVLLAAEPALFAVRGGPVAPRRRPPPTPPGLTYYLDAASGSDANPGTSPRAAWKSLARASRVAFAPGDRLLLAGGQRFPGTLRFGRAASGTPARPILVASHGSGRAT